MPERPRSLDIWIVESNTVYREVPYTVVTDWLQQGRLLPEDQIKPSDRTEWGRIDAMPAMAAFLPKAEPHRADDQAEALEPVQLEFSWKPPRGEEDEDVDMIPLIDVSLVLLIFFMMTATVGGASAFINTPIARNPTELVDAEGYWIGIDQRADGQPDYSLGRGDNAPEEGDRHLTESEAVKRLSAKLEAGRAQNIRIKANKDLPYEVVKKLTIQLETLRAKRLVLKIHAELSAVETP